jgi:nitrogenase molybdenum-iron protein beta chain
MLHELKFTDCEYSKDPLVSCALEGVAGIIAGIKDVAIVIHSPQGCAATVANAYDAHEIDFTRRKIACTRLFESDIIMGATDKLKELILQADTQFNVRVIFVVGTCAADIIGENLEAVCASVKDKVKAQLVHVMAGGFHGDAYKGMDEGLSMLLPFMKNVTTVPSDKDKVSNPSDFIQLDDINISGNKAKKIHSVNIIAPQANLNPTWWADAQWVESVLRIFGVGEIRQIARDISLDEIAGSATADANILLSHDVGFTFAQKNSNKKTRLILEDLPLPVGIENTARWLRMLGKECGAEDAAEEMIKNGELSVEDILRKRALMIIPRYRNCRIAISADYTIGIPLVRMVFQELEMIPELLLFRSDSPHARDILQRELSDLGISPHIVFSADGWKIKSALKEANVDAVIGSAWEKYIAEELGIKLAFDILAPTNRDLYIDRPYFGYDGFLNIMEAVGNDWEAAFRSKNIAISSAKKEGVPA